MCCRVSRQHQHRQCWTERLLLSCFNETQKTAFSAVLISKADLLTKSSKGGFCHRREGYGGGGGADLAADFLAGEVLVLEVALLYVLLGRQHHSCHSNSELLQHMLCSHHLYMLPLPCSFNHLCNLCGIQARFRLGMYSVLLVLLMCTSDMLQHSEYSMVLAMAVCGCSTYTLVIKLTQLVTF